MEPQVLPPRREPRVSQVKLYDKACFDLAMSFLEDSNTHPARISDLADSLAIDIQQAIEDFFAERNLNHG